MTPQPALPSGSLRRLTASVALVGLVGLIAAGCSDDDSSDGTGTTSGTPITTVAPQPTAAVDTTAATTAVPTATEALPPALPYGLPLEAGVTYRLARSVLGRSLQFTNPADGAVGLAGPGGVALIADPAGFDVLLLVVDLAKVRFFTDPLVDAYAIPDDAGLTAATSEAPADVFTYFAALPGVEAGPVTDAEIAGRPAKAMTWKFGAIAGGSPCGPSARCVNGGWLKGVGVSRYVEGDAGTIYLLDLDGQQVLVEVQDRPGAQDAADSLVIGE